MLRRYSLTAGPIAGCLGAALLLAGCQYGVTSPAAPSATTSSSSGSGGGTSTTTLTYTTDVQPILSTSCVRCHGPSRRDAGVDVSTYSNVLRYLTPGSESSLLIIVTRQGGLMYSQLGSNASTKAKTLHDWIVLSNAAQ